MPYIDPTGAAQLRTLREDRGLSPESLAREIRDRATSDHWKIGACDSSTIRRIEGNARWHGQPPGLRIRVILETYLETRIFRPENRIWVNSAERFPERFPVAA